MKGDPLKDPKPNDFVVTPEDHQHELEEPSDQAVTSVPNTLEEEIVTIPRKDTNTYTELEVLGESGRVRTSSQRQLPPIRTAQLRNSSQSPAPLSSSPDISRAGSRTSLY